MLLVAYGIVIWVGGEVDSGNLAGGSERGRESFGYGEEGVLGDEHCCHGLCVFSLQ